MKIVVLEGYSLNPGDLSWEGLEALGEVTVYDRTKESEIISRIGDAELVYTNKTPIGEKVFSACPKMKFLGVLATGYNVVDVESAKAHGVVVTNVPNYGSEAVSQFAIALLLELCHHIGAHSESVKLGDWARCQDFCYWNTPLIELTGKTMGIIGYGRIGQGTARIAQAFGMKVLANKRDLSTIEETESLKAAELDTIYKESDVIMLHCPLTPETEGMINSDVISRMKDGVLIVNNSRGPLIVEADLRVALDSGKVAGAAVDVVSTEPIQRDNVLLGAKNIIITPHIAWAALESRQRLMDIAVENLRQFLAGTPVNVVNK